MKPESPLIVLGVTGGIAAYKSCELARTLIRHGCRVKVVMTDAATRFVGPATFRALTGNPVGTSLWDEPADKVHHVSLAAEADLMIIAPATANTLAKLACGRADDLLTTTALATRAPLLVAPAMNVNMWRAEPTIENMARLKSRGISVVEPDSGELACGDVGEGRMAEPDAIAAEALAILEGASLLAGVTVLVTAGPTHEYIDPVRFIGNPSSGTTGYAIAKEAARRGARVVLVSGPVTIPDPAGVEVHRVTTALEMDAAVRRLIDDVDVVIASAAVSDYRPANPVADKVKKGSPSMSLELVANPDILASLGASKAHRVLVGFSAETTDVLDNARKKLVEKNLDLIVANDVSDASIGFGTSHNVVSLVTAANVTTLPVLDKRDIARVLLDTVTPMIPRSKMTTGS